MGAAVSHAAEPSIERIQLDVVDGVGELMDFWGFKRPMGRTWALLFLEDEPLDSQAIADRLQMSPSAASACLTDLLAWGVVRRSRTPGSRRDTFRAEPNVWKLVTRVIAQRELALVRETRERFARAESALASLRAATPSSDPARARLERLIKKTSRLVTLARAGEGLVAAFVAGGTLPARLIQNLMKSELSVEEAER